jgi:hypothetical protein
MPAPSAILERPEFAILRRLTVEQLRRINPKWARRNKPGSCPLGMALKTSVYGGQDFASDFLRAALEELEREADTFIAAWDESDEKPATISRDDLAAAIAAALAEKEGADARP